MTCLNILAPTLGRPQDETALVCAAKIATAVQGRVAALYALPDPADAFVWAGEGLTAAPSSDAIAAARQMQQESEQRVHALIAKVAQTVGAPKGIECLTRIDSTARAVVEYSALYDLIVFPDDVAKGGGPLGGAFESALLKARAPVLLARNADLIGAPAFIAWDGGLEAGRAVRGALPLLQKASTVTICQAATEVGDRARAGVDPGLLCARLKAAGIDAQVVLIEASSSANAADRIVEVSGAGSLLVAGAYAHSRAQEMIFGGATRTFLSAPGPSLLLSH